MRDFVAADIVMVFAAGFVDLAEGVALSAAQFTHGSVTIGDAAQFVDDVAVGWLS